MIKYTLWATGGGYTFQVSRGDEVLYTYDEDGGHGVIEKLYGQAERASHEVMARESHKRRLANAKAIYRGYGGQRGVRVTVERNGEETSLRHYVRHSPTGFAWGYGGSGPADLARCILIDHIHNTLHKKLEMQPDGPYLPVDYNKFKGRVVAKWPWDEIAGSNGVEPAWTLTDNEVDQFLIAEDQRG